MKEPKYRKRKPDMETEEFRMWAVDKKNKEEFKEMKDVKGFDITYKDLTMTFCGFTVARREKDNKIVFAYKFKHDEKMVLFHNPGIDKKVDAVLDEFKMVIGLIGYELKDCLDVLKGLYSQKHIIHKIGGKDDSKKSSKK